MMESVTKVKFASLLFGVGSWITITGFWAELPILIASLPEKWKLSSQLTFFIQAANIGPLVFWICRRFKLCSEVVATHVQMVIGVISCLILMIAWDQTFYLFGQERSILLFIAAFGLSLLDCTSSVTFLPFMARFKPIHLTPYLIGEGLSGFLPIVVAVIQGVGESESCKYPVADDLALNRTCFGNDTCLVGEKLLKQPRFSPNIFFTSLLVTLLLSWSAFFWLLYSKTAEAEHVERSDDCEDRISNEVKKIPPKDSGEIVTKYSILQGIIIYACLSTFGIMPAIQSYSTLPYGGWSLHYTVILTGLAYPVGCFIAMLKHTTSLKMIYIWTLLGSVVSVLILVVALLSPSPPLASGVITTLGLPDNIIGGTILIVAWTIYVTIFSYVKTVITVIVSEERGEEALFTVGLFTQIGSVFGAGFMFIVVNYLNWFQEC